MENCPLCGGRPEVQCDRYPGYQLPATFSILHCKSCDTAFTSSGKPDSSLYDAIYGHPDRVPGYDRYFRYGEDVLRMNDPLGYLAGCEPAYWACKRYLDTLETPKSVRILEIGSGLGYLTYAIASAGYEITGLDISQVAVSRAEARYGKLYLCADVRTLMARQLHSFDLVILTEVIEHVENITELILNCLKCVRDDGLVLVTTPNKSAFPADAVWRTECPPIHLWWLSDQSMRAVARLCNSCIAFLDFSDYNRDHPFPPAHDWVPHPVFQQDGTLIPRPLSGKVVHSAQKLGHRIHILNQVRRARRALRAGMGRCPRGRNGESQRNASNLCSLIAKNPAALEPLIRGGRAYS